MALMHDNLSPREPGRRSLPIGLFAVLLGLALAPSPAAGAPAKFPTELCDPELPGGASPSASFVVNPGVPFTPFNTCAQPGGAIGITETGPASATYAYWSISVPATPGGYVESLAISARACGLGAANDHTFVYEQGWPPNCADETQRLFHIRNAPPSTPLFGGGTSFTIFINCDGNVGPCGAGPSILAHYFLAMQVDVKAPVLSDPTGTLLGGGIVRGHQSLSAEARDEGGGVSRLDLIANGLPAAQPRVANCNLVNVKNPTYEGIVAASVTPCPNKLAASWTLDTSAYPFHQGENVVQVCAYDYASQTEPNRDCSAPVQVDVDNSCADSAVAGGEVLSARFAGSNGESVTVPFHAAAKVAGELTNSAGDPIAGATICVEEELQGSGRGLAPVATTVTDAQGSFTYTVPPGPNRKVLLGYRHDTFQVARAIRYFAHAKPTIQIKPARVGLGGEVSITGRLPGAGSARRVVVLQASALRSRRWFTFRRATTDGAGRFRSRYRFDATTRTTTYRIRAVVPRQSGYPWEVGHSRPALVTVTDRRP